MKSVVLQHTPAVIGVNNENYTIYSGVEIEVAIVFTYT